MREPSANRNIIVIGASASGLEALKELMGDLPAGLPRPPSFVATHLQLTPSAAATLGMVFDGLVANAAKHGARSEPPRRIEVTWRAVQAAEGDRTARRGT